jgi:hypothetical protein
MPVTAWSTTAANNNAAAPNGAPEGMPASGVNDTIRQIMADVAVEAQTNAVKVLNSISGADTITADMNPELAAYATGMVVSFTPAGTNTGAATLNVDGLGAKAIVKHNNVALVAGDLKAAAPARCIYDGTSFVLLNPLLAHTANADAAEVGFKGAPVNDQNGSYTFVLSDAGKMVRTQSPAGDTYTIPPNSSVAFPVGTIIQVCNRNTGSLALARGAGVALYIAGTGTSADVTITGVTVASLEKTNTDEWCISGGGVA